MQNPESVDLLAQDVWQGRSYVRLGESGHHYDLHVAIANKAFPGQPFDAAAAVTELFLCASKDENLLPKTGSKCADPHLDEVARQARPTVVVTVGEGAKVSRRKTAVHGQSVQSATWRKRCRGRGCSPSCWVGYQKGHECVDRLGS